MTTDAKNIIPHFEALLAWTEEGLSQPHIPYTYYQYMKMKEALESVIDSLTCFTTPVEDLPQLEERQESGPRIVVDNAPLDKLRSRPKQIKVPLPML